VVDGVPEPWRSAEGCTSLARFAVSTNTDHRTTIDDGAITAETLLLRAEDEAIQPIEYAHEPDEDIAGGHGTRPALGGLPPGPRGPHRGP
jgi:hypothetical protein